MRAECVQRGVGESLSRARILEKSLLSRGRYLVCLAEMAAEKNYLRRKQEISACSLGRNYLAQRELDRSAAADDGNAVDVVELFVNKRTSATSSRQ